jgi:hypothetical protein
VPFSCFVFPDSFLGVPTASGPGFMFCAPGLIFGSTEGIGSLFHVLRSETRFRRYRVRRVPFSRFARPDSFFAVPNPSGPVFMVCASRLVFGDNVGVESYFHVLSAQTRFRRYRGCRVPYSCFALSDSFSMVPRALGTFFMFCAPGLIFDGNDGFGSRFHLLRFRTNFRRCRMCVGSRFHVLRTRIHFRRYRGCQDPFFM